MLLLLCTRLNPFFYPVQAEWNLVRKNRLPWKIKRFANSLFEFQDFLFYLQQKNGVQQWLFVYFSTALLNPNLLIQRIAYRCTPLKEEL